MATTARLRSSLLGKSDPDFTVHSQRFPDQLASVQTARNLPGGILVVFEGTAGPSSHPFIGVIKAETQSGFGREHRGGTISARFIENLFLTPATRLYKIGVFVREASVTQTLPHGWTAFVYDRQMTIANRDGAARYFFGAFLGCEFPVNGALLTKSFFENTREFIKSLNVAPEKRADLLTSLYTYLKVDQAPTIEVNVFSNSYIADENRDDYRTFMEARKFPMTAVPKDISDLKGVLKLRKISFSNNVRLSAPPEAFHDLISIETVKREDFAPGQPSEWTVITIRDQIRDQQ